VYANPLLKKMLYSFINYKYETEREDHGRGSMPYLKLHAAVEWFCFSCLYILLGWKTKFLMQMGGKCGCTTDVEFHCKFFQTVKLGGGGGERSILLMSVAAASHR